MTTYIVHTTAPVVRLDQMVGEGGLISAGQAHTMDGNVGPDCFYGWCEPQRTEPGSGCLTHMMVTVEDEEAAKWIAATLKMLGDQVAVTYIDTVGDEVEAVGMPLAYDDAHSH